MACDTRPRLRAGRRPLAGLVAPLMALGLLAAAPGRPQTGVVHVEVEVESRAIAMRVIQPDSVRQEMAAAVAARLTETFVPYWRFEAGPVADAQAALRLRVSDNGARGVDLSLEPVGMDIPLLGPRWRSVWYTSGGLATEALPTERTAPELLVRELDHLLEQHGVALLAALKSVPVGLGAVWAQEPGDELILGLPWDRFEGSRAVFKVSCDWPRPTGPEVSVDLIGTALGRKDTFSAGDDDPGFEALRALPEKRIFGSECRRVRDILDEVRTFRMREIFLEEEKATNLMSTGC